MNINNGSSASIHQYGLAKTIISCYDTVQQRLAYQCCNILCGVGILDTSDNSNRIFKLTRVGIQNIDMNTCDYVVTHTTSIFLQEPKEKNVSAVNLCKCDIYSAKAEVQKPLLPGLWFSFQGLQYVKQRRPGIQDHLSMA